MDEFQSQAVAAMVPDILLDVDKTSLALRKNNLAKYDELVKEIEEHINIYRILKKEYNDKKKIEEDIKKRITAEIKKLKEACKEKENTEQELKKKISSLKLVISESEKLSCGSEEMNKLVEKMCIAKEEHEREKRALVQDFKTFETAISYYKKYLQCDLDFDPKTSVATLILLDQKFKDPSKQAWIKFKADEGLIHFSFLEMHPKTLMDERLVQSFKETGDIQGFLLSFWKSVKSLENRS